MIHITVERINSAVAGRGTQTLPKRAPITFPSAGSAAPAG
jgi:hypothetical protein